MSYIKSSKTFTRASTATEWYSISAEATAHFKTSFLDTGKCVQDATSTSTPDGKSKTVVRYFKDQASYTEYMSDATIQARIASRKAYNSANNITEDTASITTVDTIGG
jgi:hypothetical protein